MFARCLLLLVAMLSSLTVGLLPQVAQAAVSSGKMVWAVDAKDAGGSEVVTHPNGSVTVAACDDTPAKANAKTVNVLGVTEGAVAQSGQIFCDDLKAADGSGTVYGMQRDGEGRNPWVVAYRHGTKLWERSLDVCGQKAVPSQIVLGADRNLHVLTESVTGCNGQYRQHLAKLRTSNGSGGMSSLGSNVSRITPYKSGIILNNTRRLTYIAYDGSWSSQVAMSGDIRPIPQGSTLEGGIFFEVATRLEGGEGSRCQGDVRYRTSIVGYSRDGKMFGYDLPVCSQMNDTAVASDGSVVIVAEDDQKEFSLRSVRPDGQSVRQVLSVKDGEREFARSSPGHSLVADTKGNVVLSRRYSFAHGLPNGYDDTREGYKFEVRNAATLQMVSQFYTDAIDPVSTFELSDEHVGLAAGKLYFVAQKCDADQCASSAPKLLYAVSMPVGMDYPRAAVQTGQPVVAAKCPSLLFVGVRGSGESADSHSGLGSTVGDVRNRLTQQYPGIKTAAIDYAAVPIMYGNWVGYLGEYERSKENGKKNLTNYLAYIASACPNVGIVGVGYSQGAHVVGDVFSGLVSAAWLQRIKAVVLIGDPRFNAAQTEVNAGTYDGVQSGIYSGPRQIPSSYTGRMRSYCLDKDPVCSLGSRDMASCITNPSECMHGRYLDTGWTRKAGEWVVSILK